MTRRLEKVALFGGGVAVFVVSLLLLDGLGLVPRGAWRTFAEMGAGLAEMAAALPALGLVLLGLLLLILSNIMTGLSSPMPWPPPLWLLFLAAGLWCVANVQQERWVRAILAALHRIESRLAKAQGDDDDYEEDYEADDDL